MKKYRALWLMNHKTLRAFEVPMLIDMGFEIYCPKSFPYDEGNLSASVDYQYDETLSIPREVIGKLDEVDFYNDMPNDILKLLNQYFDIAFIGFFPNQLRTLVYGFRGVIVMQAFGLANDLTYTDVIVDCLGVSFLERIKKLGDRFFFAQAYDNISEIECRYFRNQSIYLPLGLKDAYATNKWVGGDKRILFVCPRIETSPYFANIYKNFKNDFKGYDYIVGGAQPISVDDPKVVGYIPKYEYEYEYEMTHLDVMFYHSREERHLHFHPIEAVKNGMPLVYMSGGVLQMIAGEKTLGCCDTIQEARKKIDRIIRGDKSFIKKIIKSQVKLLAPFQYEYCREKWNQEFKKILPLLEKGSNIKTRKTKIGILLTEGYTGGVLDFTLRFVKCLYKGVEKTNDDVELVFGYVDKTIFEEKDYFEEIRQLGIQIRKFDWKKVDVDYIRNVYRFMEYDINVVSGNYCIPDDGTHYFEDCDYLILTVANIPAYFFTTKPYAVVNHDCIQRYVPEMYGAHYEKEIISLERNSEAVFVMTPETQKDTIQYVGLPQTKVRLIPLLFEVIDQSIPCKFTKDEYFLWSTNRQRHKNHLKALEALSSYYGKGGRLKCIITGVGTEAFEPNYKYEENNDYILQIRDKISSDKFLSANIECCGNLNKEQYINILRNAAFFFHPGLADNGNMTSVDAACFNVPTISGDYPQMRYYQDYMHLGIRFFDPFNPGDITKMIFYMEENLESCKTEMPNIEQIKKFTIETTYMEVYMQVKEVFKF